MDRSWKLTVLVVALFVETTTMAASTKEIDECVRLLRDFNASSDKPRNENDLKHLKECLAKLKAAKREPPATIFRGGTANR